MTRKDMIRFLENMPQQITIVQFPDFNGHLEARAIFGPFSHKDLGRCQYIIWQGDHSKALRDRNKMLCYMECAVEENEYLPLHVIIAWSL